MSIPLSENKYYLNGNIESSIYLDSSNSQAGSTPSDITILTYDDETYDDSVYAITGVYDATFYSPFIWTTIEWTSSVDNLIKYQIKTSNDGTTYSAWSAEANAKGIGSYSIGTYYFKIRFLFYSNLWSNSDNVYIKTFNENTPVFKILAEDTTISALDVMSNYEFIGKGDWLPTGNENMEYTTGVYDLGADNYLWNDIYITNANVSGYVTRNFNCISDTVLTSTASSIEISGLNGDVDEIYELVILTKYTTSVASITCSLVFNQDTATNYQLQKRLFFEGGIGPVAEWNPSCSGIHLGDFRQYSTLDTIFSNLFIYTKTGHERMSILKQIGGCHTGGINQYLYEARIQGAFWNNTTNTVTSMTIYSEDGVARLNPGTRIRLFAKR